MHVLAFTRLSSHQIIIRHKEKTEAGLKTS